MDSPPFAVWLCCGAVSIALLVIFAVVVVQTWMKHHRESKRREILSLTRNIYSLSPQEFEEYVGILLSQNGFSVKHTGRSGDQGIDLRIVSPKGHKGIVQCKRYKPGRKLGPSAVRALRGTMTREDVRLAYLVTTAEFTNGARKEGRAVKGQRINFIDGHDLARAAERVGLPGHVMFSRRT
jgi:restriction system protein